MLWFRPLASTTGIEGGAKGTNEMASDSALGGAEPKSIGSFELLSELHKGFFGAVWLAKATSGDDAGHVVLVRRIDVSGDVDEATAGLVFKAAERAKGIRHPSIAGTLDVVRAGSELALVSEYEEAEPLRTVLRLAGIGRKPVPPAVVARIAIDALEACLHLHEHDVLGALTPDNVLVGSDGVTRILEPVASQVAARVTVWKEQPKRATYSAPEQLGDEPGDERSDMFAVGVLAWEMLRNRPLFGGANFAQIADRVRSAAIGRADALKPAGGEVIPKALADVVERALSRAPEQRFATATEMLEALDACHPADHAEVAHFATELLAEAFSAQRRKRGGLNGAVPVTLPAAVKATEEAATEEAANEAAATEAAATEAVATEEAATEAVATEEAATEEEEPAAPARAPQPAKRRQAQQTLMGMAAPAAARAVTGATKPKFPPPRMADEDLDVDPEPASRASVLPDSDPEPPLDEEADDFAAGAGVGDSSPAEGFGVLSIADDPSDPDDPSGEVAASLARSAASRQANSNPIARAPAKPAFTVVEDGRPASSGATRTIALALVAAAVLAFGAYFAFRGSSTEAPVGAAAPSAAVAATPAATATATATAAPVETAVPTLAVATAEAAPAPTSEPTTTPAATPIPPTPALAPQRQAQGAVPRVTAPPLPPRQAPSRPAPKYNPSDI